MRLSRLVRAAVAVLLAVPMAAAQDSKPKVQMTTYQMVLLRTGPNHDQPAADGEKLQAGHLAFLAKLNRERVNLLYGPFLDGGDLRGLAVLDVPDAETAKKLFAEEPHVRAGNLVMEVKPWYGPKGWFHLPDEPNTPEQFVFGFLVRGPNRQQPEAEAQEIQKGHLAYMEGLHQQGKLVMAGPFGDDGDWRGVVVYRVATLEEARQLAAGDPAVKAGRLVIEAHPWMTFKGILK